MMTMSIWYRNIPGGMIYIPELPIQKARQRGYRLNWPRLWHTWYVLHQCVLYAWARAARPPVFFNKSWESSILFISFLWLHFLSRVWIKHEAGIIHRDLRFESIVFEHAGAKAGIKITDFGIAKRVRSSDNNGSKIIQESIGSSMWVVTLVLKTGIFWLPLSSRLHVYHISNSQVPTSKTAQQFALRPTKICHGARSTPRRIYTEFRLLVHGSHYFYVAVRTNPFLRQTIQECGDTNHERKIRHVGRRLG